MLISDFAQFKGNRFAEIILKFPCPQKILMVTDPASTLDRRIRIVGIRRHRHGRGPHGGDRAAKRRRAATTIPGNFNFATAATPVTTANYDQIWLFGFSTTALSAPEQTTIAQFMKSGGGVFATGDHETIGAGMGANIPRVRRMRNWSTIPMVNPSRHDTVLNPGADNIKQFQDQADAIPQRHVPGVLLEWRPGQCGDELERPSGAAPFVGRRRLPARPPARERVSCAHAGGGKLCRRRGMAGADGGGPRIPPQVVAVSISAGRFITDTLKPPVRPRCFGAISAYDGDAAGRGRIVCDATWHHFVNINLNGRGADTRHDRCAAHRALRRRRCRRPST